ncbi:nicotinate (nicotinamide) nucleotide adenylyltransferase [Fodinibius sediminis]|uniref:Probable nicotinate-nucleotide adenylyltransferase n=1 Tax=Fodinibius sediminis TaxID=1214077 RepID=A0A521DCB7_9BACT|nr:nicotinate (nicotinamide) nucleotide adenylyltransferase [Fodinibius sediminis]SMO69238.1 nicotinate-nucleotide adenylyltransferase [Fodinibius sediminis]
MASAGKSVGLLGGSYDPVHNGHLAIARSFVESGYISNLRVLLTPESPHKSSRKPADYDLRLKMLEAAFDGEDQISVSDLERRLQPPYYTVQTLRYLTEKEPGINFFLCIGEDSLLNFRTWHMWKELLTYCDLLVAARPSFETENLDAEITRKVHYVEHAPVAISSTQVRNRVKEGRDISKLVPPRVAQIITEHKLYTG